MPLFVPEQGYYFSELMNCSISDNFHTVTFGLNLIGLGNFPDFVYSQTVL